MPYFRPLQQNSGVAYGPLASHPYQQRAAGVPPPAPTGLARDLQQAAALTNVGSQLLSSIDQYIRNQHDLQAQRNIFEVTSAYQSEQVASQVSSRTASDLLRVLQLRMSVTASNAERAQLQQQFTKWTEIQRLAKEREEWVRKVAWGVGIAAVIALAAGGGWYYYSKKRG